jgi:Uncharacterized proteins involved in stress response, homologs of TerZ and putative cAMP-binding protein CABP1
MTVNIKKSQVRLGLGWDKRRDGGLDFDLDAMVFLVDGNGRLDNQHRIAYERQPQGLAPLPVLIYNDNTSGEGEGDNEVVDIDLARLPSHIIKVVIACAINQAEKREQSLGQVAGLFMRLMTLPDKTEITRYEKPLSPIRGTALVMGELLRSEDGWTYIPKSSYHEGGFDEIMSRWH